MIETVSLGALRVGETLSVLSVGGRDDMRQRFIDLGIDEDTEITCVMIGPLGGIKAYDIRGAIIALRLEDADCIIGKIKAPLSSSKEGI